MRSNKGKLLAPPTAKEVVWYHTQELWQSLLHPRQFLNRRYGYRHGVVGRLGFMLTLFAFIYFAIVYIQEKTSALLHRIPASSYATACSVVLSCILIQGFNLLPAPQQGLDVTKLMKPFSQSSFQSIYQDEQEAQFVAIIPEELKRIDEIEYMMVEPFTVAYNKPGNVLWNTPTDNTENQTIARPALPKVHTEHKVEYGENFSVIAKAYGTSVEQLQLYNPNVQPKRMQIGEKLVIPGASQPKKIKRRVNSKLLLPLRSDIVNSGYGYRRHPIGGNIRFHHGVDFKGGYGTNVRASMDGVVVEANGRSGALGRHVIIRHNNGLETVYAHLSRYYPKRGDSVSRGQIIGTVGSTGRTTGPHLHYEIRKNGKSVDPKKYLSFRLRKK